MSEKQISRERGERKRVASDGFVQMGFEVTTDRDDILNALNEGEYIPYGARAGGKIEYGDRDVNVEMFLARMKEGDQELRLALTPKSTLEWGAPGLNFSWSAMMADGEGNMRSATSPNRVEIVDGNRNIASVNHDTSWVEMANTLARLVVAMRHESDRHGEDFSGEEHELGQEYRDILRNTEKELSRDRGVAEWEDLGR